MRKIDNLSTDAITVLLYIQRQRARLQQHIPLSEIATALEYEVDRLAAALRECEGGGWVLSSIDTGHPHYSLIATNRRLLRRLTGKLN